MKAALVDRYGHADVVRVGTIEAPVPDDDEVLIRVHATTVSAADWRIRSGDVPRGFGLMLRLAFGWRGPRGRVLGTELAGVVEVVGARVRRFAVGDAVFACTGMKLGAHAEFAVMPEDGKVLPIPPGVGMEEASAICFGGLTALFFLRDKAKVCAGERVLIVGASGAVGSAAVQLAKSFGADVTGVCSARNAEFVRGLGADRAIDYYAVDYTTNGERYDVIFDAVGTESFARCKDSLAEGGRLLLAAASLGQTLAALWQRRGGVRVIAGSGPESRDDMATLAEWCALGVYKPFIGARFPLNAIAEAHALVESRRKRGNVVVVVRGAA